MAKRRKGGLIKMMEGYMEQQKKRRNNNEKLLTRAAWVKGLTNGFEESDKVSVQNEVLYEMIAHNASSILPNYDKEDYRKDAMALLDLLYGTYTSMGMDALIAELFYVRCCSAKFDSLVHSGRGASWPNGKGTKKDVERAETHAELWHEAKVRRYEIEEEE